MPIALLITMPPFIFWKSSIPFDDNLQKAFKTIRFNVAEATDVSEHFAAGVPFNGIDILIEVPKSYEDCRKFNVKLSSAPPSSLGYPERQKIEWSRACVPVQRFPWLYTVSSFVSLSTVARPIIRLTRTASGMKTTVAMFGFFEYLNSRSPDVPGDWNHHEFQVPLSNE
jgi:hypothetical protein